MPTLSALVSPSTKNPPGSFDFKKTLEPHFPRCLPLGCLRGIFPIPVTPPFGMNQKNSIACVSVCRDKITTQFMKRLHNAWNGTFKFSSLAGSCISVLRDFKPPIIMLPILMAEKDTCILPFPIPPSMATQDPKSSHKLGAYWFKYSKTLLKEKPAWTWTRKTWSRTSQTDCLENWYSEKFPIW